MKKIAALLALIALATACTGDAGSNLDDLYKNLPFDMLRVSLPSIPARSVCLTDFGGVGDGVTLNTEAFSKGIAELAKEGGGRLIVPQGIWLTGPIELKDNL